jgi:hypothetical protein
MHRSALVIASCVAACALSACGPGAKISNGKQGAAEALYAASRPSKASADKTAAPIDIGTISWSCPEGGSAKVVGLGVAIDLTGGAAVAQKVSIAFNSCGLAKPEVGTAVFNGELAFTQAVNVTTSQVGLNQKILGKVLVQGAFDDFLDADVTQTVAVGALDGTGSVGMTLKGSISTSTGSYTFDEMVSVIAGHLSASVSASK